MDYTAWRITYQCAEQAARAAYRSAQEHLAARQAAEAELATHRGDLEEAAGALMLPLPEPGSDMARVMRVNRILHREIEALRQIKAAELHAPDQAAIYEAQAQVLEEELPEMFDQVDANRLEKRAIDLRHKAREAR